jgi:biopolymer transport protein ExbD
MKPSATIVPRRPLHRKNRRRFSFAVNLTPMMDVMFNLLIFFIVTASFAIPEGSLEAKLPQSTGIADPNAAIPLVPIQIFLETTANDDMSLISVSNSINAERKSLTLVSSFDALFVLLESMKAKPGIDEKTPIIIAAKPAVTWDQVVGSYNACIRAKYKRVVFAGY